MIVVATGTLVVNVLVADDLTACTPPTAQPQPCIPPHIPDSTEENEEEDDPTHQQRRENRRAQSREGRESERVIEGEKDIDHPKHEQG